VNDLEARQAIRGSLDETLVVEAAAGTGRRRSSCGVSWRCWPPAAAAWKASWR
jgi:hypothetical protein